MKFAQGLGRYFAVALLNGCLVALAAQRLPTFGGRMVFVLLVSLYGPHQPRSHS